MAHFVFIEFTDCRLVSFLARLREALQGRPSRKPIHITVRGPYQNPPSAESLFGFSERLAGLGVRLIGAGTFETSEGYAVFIRAESVAFRDIWWKRDFPETVHGTKPHVTIFETANGAHAKEVESFLRTEQIKIFTPMVKLSVYRLKQGELFSVDEGAAPEADEGLPDEWGLRPQIILRARELGRRLSAR